MSVAPQLLLLALTLLGCSDSDTAKRSVPTRPTEQRFPLRRAYDDTLVVARVLESIKDADSTYRKPVIQRETAAPYELEGENPQDRLKEIHRRMLPGLLDSTEKSFWERNAAPDTLESVVLRLVKNSVSAAEFRRDVLEAPEGWKTFFQRYPGSGGFTVLSRPGYSADGKQALIYVSIACPLCGRGEYLLLSKTPAGNWEIAAHSVDWLS